MFLRVGGTAIVQLINFVIFFALLNVVFIRPVGKAIAKRREYINSLTSDYDRYQAEAAALRMQAESIRASARRESVAAIARARAQASKEAAEIAAEYGRRCTQTIEEAQRTVAAELDAVRRGEASRVRELASLLLDRTLAESAT